MSEPLTLVIRAQDAASSVLQHVQGQVRGIGAASQEMAAKAVAAAHAVGAGFKTLAADAEKAAAAARKLGEAAGGMGGLKSALSAVGSTFKAVAEVADVALGLVFMVLKKIVGTVIDLAEKLVSVLGDALKKTAELATKVGGALFALGAAAVTAFMYAGIEANKFHEGQMRVFTALMKSKDAAAGMLDYLEKFAASKPFTAEQIDLAAAKLVAFKLDVKELLPVVTDLSVVWSRFQPEEVAGMLGRFKSGMVDVRELTELGLSRQDLAQHGVQFDTSGQPVDRRSVLPGVVAAIRDTYGGASGEATGWEAVETTVTTNFRKIARLATESLFNALKSGLGKLGTVLDTLTTDGSLVKALAVPFDLLGRAVSWAADRLPALVAWLEKIGSQENVVTVLSKIGGSLKSVWDEIARLFTGDSKAAMDGFWAGFKAVAEVAIGAVRDGWNYLVGAIGYFADNSGAIWDTLKQGAQGLKDILLEVVDAVKTIAATLGNLGFGGAATVAVGGTAALGAGKALLKGAAGRAMAAFSGGGGEAVAAEGAAGVTAAEGGGLAAALLAPEVVVPAVVVAAGLGAVWYALHGGSTPAGGGATARTGAAAGAGGSFFGSMGGFLSGANEAGIAAVHSGRDRWAQEQAANEAATRKQLEAGLGANGEKLSPEEVQKRTAALAAFEAAKEQQEADQQALKRVADKNAAYYDSLLATAKLAAAGVRNLNTLTGVAAAQEVARRAAEEANTVIPVLVAKQRDLFAEMQSFPESEKEHWEIAKQISDLGLQQVELAQTATKADNALKLETQHHVVELADAQAAYVESIISNNPLLKRNPFMALKERMREVVPALLEKYKALKNAVIPGESDAERLKRLMQAEDTKGEIMKAAGADEKPVWTLESLLNTRRAQQQMMNQWRQTGQASGVPTGFDPYSGAMGGYLSPSARAAMQSISDADASSAGVAARAAGGPVGAANAYLVGEKGPELFVPTAPGFIIPNTGLSYGGARADGGSVSPYTPGSYLDTHPPDRSTSGWGQFWEGLGVLIGGGGDRQPNIAHARQPTAQEAGMMKAREDAKHAPPGQYVTALSEMEKRAAAVRDQAGGAVAASWAIPETEFLGYQGGGAGSVTTVNGPATPAFSPGVAAGTGGGGVGGVLNDWDHGVAPITHSLPGYTPNADGSMSPPGRAGTMSRQGNQIVMNNTVNVGSSPDEVRKICYGLVDQMVRAAFAAPHGAAG